MIKKSLTFCYRGYEIVCTENYNLEDWSINVSDLDSEISVIDWYN